MLKIIKKILKRNKIELVGLKNLVDSFEKRLEADEKIIKDILEEID